MVRCADNSLYTGITTDLDRRIHEHNTSLTWAKYTKYKRPVELAWSQSVPNRSRASKIEYHIKQKTKQEKEVLIHTKENISLDSL